MNLRPRRAEEPEINLIPLIDVLLVLVVFFLMSTTFVIEGRVRLRLPEVGLVPTARPADATLSITVSSTGSYRVNDRELINGSAETLRTAIQRVAGTNRNRIVTLRADARATHQAVITAMDVLGRLGYREIQIATIHSGDSAAGAAAAPRP